MTYTNQVVSDTSNQLDEVEKCRERHLKIQRDRLVDEFTTAITAFQVCIFFLLILFNNFYQTHIYDDKTLCDSGDASAKIHLSGALQKQKV